MRFAKCRPGRTFYECGICSAYHPAEWNGDCRQDDARFFADELDARFGGDWDEIDMDDVDDYWFEKVRVARRLRRIARRAVAPHGCCKSRCIEPVSKPERCR